MKFIYPHIAQSFKRLKPIFFCLIIFFISEKKLYSQQFNNWYFRVNNGLNFNTIPPSFLSGSPFDINNSFGSATISDKNGNLLFSSDGTKVWNKNNNQMPNGFGLLGDNCNINGVLIIPFIDDENRFYIFTAKGLNNYFPNYQSTLPYSYSIVDLSLNGGLGDVINKNTFIRNYSTEKMVAIPNANGTDIWWVCRDWTNHFYSYKITCIGFIKSNPVISTVGENLNEDRILLGAADIKASPNGKYIAVAYNNYFEIYQFDKLTGLLSNPIKIPVFVSYGVEFSPDNRYLYISAQGFPDLNTLSGILQFDLSNYDSASIYNSAVNLNDSYGNFVTSTACLQLGPDGKIYIGSLGPPYLAAINLPNKRGNAALLQDSVIIMPNQVLWRLPYSYTNLISNQNVQATYTVAPDCRTVTLNAKTYIKGNNLAFNWKFGDGDSAIQNVISGGDTTYTTIVHTYPLVSGVDTFFASLTVTSDTVCGLGRAGAKVVVRPPPPIAKFGFTVGNCGSSTVQFTDSSLLNFNPSLTYQWAYKRAAASGGFINFSTAPNPVFTFSAIDSFEVRLTVTSSLSCVNDNSITKRIYLTALPIAAFTIADTCAGSTIRLQNISTGASISSYKWLFGSGDSSTAALPVYAYPAAGNYSIRLTIVTTDNCTASAIQSITINPKPVAAFRITESCLGKPITIANNSSGIISNYNWQASDGQSFADANPVILFNSEGNYNLQLKVQSPFGCSDSTNKPISISNVKITATSDTSILINQPLQLTANGAANYLWQPATLLNSATFSNPIFKVANSGLYPIMVQGTTTQGCKGTAAINITVYNTKAGLLLPNAFSPNGDNLNEVLRLNCTGLQSLSYFRIFNRYGQAIYEQRICGNAVGWDGKYKGIAQNPGAYIYQWQGVDFEGKLLNGKGTVMLLR